MKIVLFLFTFISVALSQGLEIIPLKQGIYLHKSYKQTNDYGYVSANGLVVVDGKDAYIIDTPWSENDTDSLVRWIRSNGYKPVASLSTHSHEDRTAGISILNSYSIATYTSEQTREMLKKNGKVLPKHSFSQTEFWLLENQILAFYPGGGHTVDNIVVWLPNSRLLYGGCLIRSLESKTLGYIGEASIERWAGSVQKLLKNYPTVETVVPGHGNVGSKQLLEHTKKLAASKIKHATKN